MINLDGIIITGLLAILSLWAAAYIFIVAFRKDMKNEEGSDNEHE